MSKSPELTETISRTVAQQPFFASLLFDLMEVKDNPAIDTARTDGKFIEFNPEWLKKMTLDERVFVMAHEILHGVYDHMGRGTSYEQRGIGPDMKVFRSKYWHEASDYVINAILVESKVGLMPHHGLHSPRIDSTCHVDAAYEIVSDMHKDDEDNKNPQPQPQPQPGDGAPGDGAPGDGAQDPPDNKPGFDEHEAPSQQQQQDRSEAKVKRAVKTAESMAKSMGNMPSAMERLIGDIIEPRIDWKAQLHALITAGYGHDSTSWSRPNRRKLVIGPKVYLPGRVGTQINGVVVICDTSGSVSEEEHTAFMGELAGILGECRPKWCKVLWVDAEVSGEDDVDDVEDLTSLVRKGGGGTDMTAGFKHIEDNNLDPELCVVMTDGHTPYGDETPYRTIWCSTGPEAPWGENIHVDIS